MAITATLIACECRFLPDGAVRVSATIGLTDDSLGKLESRHVDVTDPTILAGVAATARALAPDVELTLGVPLVVPGDA